MPTWLMWAIWIGGGLLSALALRALLRRFVPAWLSDSLLAVYFAAPFVFIVLAGLPAQLAGWQMYGFDATDWRQRAAQLNLVYAPWGLPLVFGMPALVIWDLVQTIRRSVART